MEMKYHVQEKGPRLVSLGEMHLWQDQLGKNQQDSESNSTHLRESVLLKVGVVS